MSGMRKRLQGFIHAIEDLPVEVTDIETTSGCHFKIFVTCKEHRRFFICAGSSSDHRAIKNFRSDVSKWIRQKESANAN